jgi:predicted dehydrogenase
VTVDRLVAAIRGEMSSEELAADLRCAVNAVAVMDACYASAKSGGWVDVMQVGG